jgi:hypothetical protein
VNELNDPMIVKSLAKIETLDEDWRNWAKFFSRGYGIIATKIGRVIVEEID